MKKAFFSFFLICLLFLSMQAFADLSSNLQIVREIAPVTKKTTSETYVDGQGNPTVASDKGYATITYKYNAMNMVIEKRFLDAEGNTVNCIDGYACIQYEYYVKKVIRTVYLDADGRYAIGPDGYALREVKHGERGIEKEAFEYDAEGKLLLHVKTEYVNEKLNNQVKSKAWYDADEKLTPGPEGYAKVIYEYRNKLKIHTAYYNADGSLFFNKKDGFAEKEQIYEKGKLSEVVYRQGQGELASGPDGYARATYTYSRDGKETQIMYYKADGSPFYTKDGYCGIRQYRKNDQSLDESYYVEEGVRGNCINGYSRTVIRYNLYKQITSQSYYDDMDQLVCPEGQVYAKIKNTYTGRYLIKTEYFGMDEKHVLGPDGYAVVAYKYAKKRKAETDFYAEDGKTHINSKDGYAKVVYKYDNTKQKQCISEAYYDAEGNRKAINGEADELRFSWNSSKQKISESYWKDGQPANCEKGYHEIRTEYNGKKVKSQSYYDSEGNRTLCKDGYAGTGKLYNSQGKDMATLYYDEQWKVIKAPGKEYAYVLTIPEKDKKVLAEEEQEEENEEIQAREQVEEGKEELKDGEKEEIIQSSTVFVEYYGTDSKLMNLSSGYAYIIRQTDDQGRIIREEYFDNKGNKAVLKNGYDEIRQYYSEGKRPNRIEYYLNGVTALYGDNYAAVEREYDEAGNTIVERYYDTAFQPASCKNGYEMIHKEYNEIKKVKREEYFYHDGKPMTNNIGVFCTVFEYNEKGKVTKETYINESGEHMPCKQGYVSIERIYNIEDNSVMGTLYYGESGELLRLPGNEYAYMLTTPVSVNDDIIEGVAKTVYNEFYGTDRKLVNLSVGYAFKLRQTDIDGRVIREVYYDKNGQKALVRNSYDEIRQFYTNEKLPSRIEYYRNNQLILRDVGYAVVEREYDDNGNTIVEKYYDTNYQPTSCSKGYEIVNNVFNDKKQINHESYYDHDGKPMTNRKGVYQTSYQYTVENTVRREEYYDYLGNPMRNIKGVYATAFDYNSRGKVSREEYYNTNGEPMKCTEGYASMEKMYTEKGNSIATLYYNETGELIRLPGNEYAYMITTPEEEYEDIIEGVASTVNIEFYGTNRKLMNLSIGYASKIRQKDKQGRTIREVYYNTDGQKALVRNTYDEIRQEYTNGSLPNRIEYYRDSFPVLCDAGYAVVDREYDDAGNIIVERYYDIAFDPIACSKGYEMVIREYNNEKRVSKESYFTNAAEPMLNNKGVYQTVYEYNKKGKVIRESYFNADGQPMVNKNGYTMIVREYDENGNKISETNYPLKEQ